MGYKGHVPMIHRGAIDAHLDTRPGVVYWISMAVTTGSGTLRLRDGNDSDAEILITLEIDAGQPLLSSFSPPLPYKRGLFVDLVDHIYDFTICFDHLEPPK